MSHTTSVAEISTIAFPNKYALTDMSTHTQKKYSVNVVTMALPLKVVSVVVKTVKWLWDDMKEHAKLNYSVRRQDRTLFFKCCSTKGLLDRIFPLPMQGNPGETSETNDPTVFHEYVFEGDEEMMRRMIDRFCSEETVELKAIEKFIAWLAHDKGSRKIQKKVVRIGARRWVTDADGHILEGMHYKYQCVITFK